MTGQRYALEFGPKAIRSLGKLDRPIAERLKRRGVVHFHAIIRLDGPAGPTTPPPAWA